MADNFIALLPKLVAFSAIAIIGGAILFGAWVLCGRLLGRFGRRWPTAPTLTLRIVGYLTLALGVWVVVVLSVGALGFSLAGATPTALLSPYLAVIYLAVGAFVISLGWWALRALFNGRLRR